MITPTVRLAYRRNPAGAEARGRAGLRRPHCSTDAGPGAAACFYNARRAPMVQRSSGGGALQIRRQIVDGRIIEQVGDVEPVRPARFDAFVDLRQLE